MKYSIQDMSRNKHPGCVGIACTTILNRRSLGSYPNAICNDGSTAAYYVDEEAHKDGQSVMVKNLSHILKDIEMRCHITL